MPIDESTYEESDENETPGFSLDPALENLEDSDAPEAEDGVTIGETVVLGDNRDTESAIEPPKSFDIPNPPTSDEQTLDFRSLAAKGGLPAAADIADLADYVGTVQLKGDLPPSDSDHELELDSNHTQRTINPRQLSPEEAELWESLAGTFSGDSTRHIPAIERSFSETKLHIRPRQMVTPRADADVPADYRLVRLLGRGGMGNVFLAKQQSLDRVIAIKIIKPLEDKKRKQLEKKGRLGKVEADRRHQFLSEAVVTGDLDHPNIVPIYDIALTPDNTLFYGMKRVVGTPWSHVIKEKTLGENLEIFLKVCDAVGFAHTRGVVHRDIKPENVMLGDFGVVMVMDWGMALAKPSFEKLDSIAHTAGLGGTPAFMAPEMALGPVDSIQPQSDVYLLGGTLFLMITGTPPHQAATVRECVRAAAKNEIVPTEPKHQGELLDIAMKALATLPADRYQSVLELQAAVREYQSHAESIALARKANSDLANAIGKRSYENFSRATYRFEEAIELWPQNTTAISGLAKTRIAHAEAAYSNNDYELGLSILDAQESEHQLTIEKLNHGLKERESKNVRLTLMRRVAAAMLAFILVGGAIALFFIIQQRNSAIASKDAAVASEQAAVASEAVAKEATLAEKASRAEEKRQREIAETNARIAEQNAQKAAEAEKIAKAQTKVANQATEEAKELAKKEQKAKIEAEEERLRAVQLAASEEKQRKIADREKQKADYEVYLSKIGLAKARVEGNEFVDARRILLSLQTQRGSRGLGWEWRWLWRQSNLSQQVHKTDDAIVGLAAHPTRKQVFVVLENGAVQTVDLDNAKSIPANLLAGKTRYTCVSISPNARWLALASAAGTIDIWDVANKRPAMKLTGHEASVNDLVFESDTRLISGSDDRTIRVWNPQSGKQLASCWHIAPVKRIDSARVNNRQIVVSAISDRQSGRAVVWEYNPGASKLIRVGEFLQHKDPVTSIALSAASGLVASGDRAGNVLVWNPTATQKTDYATAITDAVQQLDSAPAKKADQKRVPSSRLIDASLKSSTKYASTFSLTPNREPTVAHVDAIESIGFSADGTRLVTSSDDYTVKVWDVKKRSVEKTLKGHGGWVTSASFLGSMNDKLVSVSRDKSVRTWNIDSYIGSTSTLTNAQAAPNKKPIQANPHSDQILSASLDASGTRVVTSSRDQTARVLLIDPQTLRFSKVTQLQDNEQDSLADEDRLSEGTAFLAMSVAVDRVHNRLYVGSADATVRAWDLNRGTEISQATGTGLNTIIAISADGSRMLTSASSQDVKAILWQIDPLGNDSPKRLHSLRGHDQAVTAFAISPNGKYIFTGDRIGLGVLWDAQTGKPLGRRFENWQGFRINSVAFSADGQRIIVAGDDHQVSVIDLRTRELVKRMRHSGPVVALSLSADGQYAATISENRNQSQVTSIATFWSLKNGAFTKLDQMSHRISGGAGKRIATKRFNSIEFGTQNSIVALSTSAAGNTPGTIQLFNVQDLRTGVSKPKTISLPARLSSAQVAMPMNNRELITLCGDAAFKWDLQSLVHTTSYRSHAAVTKASFSFDGRFVATGSRSVKIWDTATGIAVGKLESPHQGIVQALQFSPKGPGYLFATAGNDGAVYVWNWNPQTKQFDKIRNLDLQPDADNFAVHIHDLSFDPTGRRLLLAGSQGTIRLWPAINNEAPIELDLNVSAAMTCSAISSDGKWLAVGGDDKIARMWPMDKIGQKDVLPFVFQGHADLIEDIHIVTDGTSQVRLLTASRDKSSRVWDPYLEGDGVGREIISLRRHTQGVTAIDATDDGRLVMTAGRDGSVILWPANRPPN